MSTPLENRTLWVKALRSGRFEQGKTYLRNHDCFCAWGVACDLLMDDLSIIVQVGFKDAAGIDHAVGTYAYDGARCSPPDRVRIAMGLDLNQAQSIATRNDQGYTFAQVADIIEKIR